MKKMIVRAFVGALLASCIVGQSNSAYAGSHCGRYTRPVYYAAPQPVQTTAVSQTSITAVVITPAKPSLPQVPAGSSMRIKVNFLGDQTGHVFLNVDNLVMECSVLVWTPNYVEFALPAVGIVDPTEATINVVTATGLVARSTKVMLNPTKDIEVLESVEVIPRAARTVSPRVPAITGGLEVAPNNEASVTAPPSE